MNKRTQKSYKKVNRQHSKFCHRCGNPKKEIRGDCCDMLHCACRITGA